MIIYFSKMYQSVPGLISIQNRIGGIFVTTRVSTYFKIKKNYPNVTVKLYKEKIPYLKQYRGLLENASVIVTGSPLKSFLKRFSAKKVMTFHGTYAYVKTDELNHIDHFDYFLSMGQRLSSFLERGNFKGKIIDSGYFPFLEYSEFSKDQRQEYLKNLGLSPYKPTVLYMPRGNPYGTWDVMARRLIDELSEDFNLILRPHPSQSTKFNLISLIKNLQIKWKLKKRVHSLFDACNFPVSSIFSVSDIVMCDGASSPEESLYYNLPILLIESENSSKLTIREQLKRGGKSDAEIDALLEIYDCGTVMNLNDDINQSVLATIHQAKDKSDKQNQYFEWVFGQRNSNRQLAAIAFLLNLK